MSVTDVLSRIRGCSVLRSLNDIEPLLGLGSGAYQNQYRSETLACISPALHIGAALDQTFWIQEQMEISLFQDDEPLRFERIIIYPYPDLKRIWTRVWVTAKQDQDPNLEVKILNPDGTENSSIYLLAQTDQKIERHIHMRDGIPGETYKVIAELSLGITDPPELLERQEFDMILEFRNPDEKQPGFGYGIDWNEFQKSV